MIHGNVNPDILTPEDEHVCDFKDSDCDICKGCGEHTQFCEECGSECCGEPPYSTG
jgi:hypothetical protein